MFLFGLIQSLLYDSSNTVYISGSPRSGTSWLGEMLAQPEGSVTIWEPFHLRHQPDLVKRGFEWRTYISDKPEDREKRSVIEHVIRGRRLNHHTLKDVSLSQLLKRKRFVVKSVRSNWFLGLIAREFPIRTPVCIIRHPCAVVSSQMHRRTRHQTVTAQRTIENWSGELPAPARQFLSRYPEYRTLLENLETWEEILAASWCMDNIELLKADDRLPYIVVPYERLVRDDVDVLIKLFERLNLEWEEEYRKGLHRASSTVVEGSNVAKGKDPLTGWKSRLSVTQIRQILRVVDRFDSPFYGEEVEPDYEKINKISAVEL